MFLIDPPYLSTDCSTYNKSNYWRLSDYLNVLKTIEDQSYFYFTSNKSHIVELFEWLGTTTFSRNPFADAKIIKLRTINFNTSYEDIMIYRNTL